VREDEVYKVNTITGLIRGGVSESEYKCRGDFHHRAVVIYRAFSDENHSGFNIFHAYWKLPGMER
jgi:hypothetical protein